MEDYGGFMPVFEWRSTMPVPAEELYAYHTRPGAVERLLPPWWRLHVVAPREGTQEVGTLIFERQVGPVTGRWSVEVTGHIEGRQYVVRQTRGPFGRWEHTHRFVPIDARSSVLLDHVEYCLSAGGLADFVGEGPAATALRRLFRFRHERARRDLARHAAWADRPRLKVAISGASGLIGSNLAVYLTTAGHEVVRLVRRQAKTGEVAWDPARGRLDPAALAGVTALVNASGESLNGIWTAGKRRAILTSRLQTTGTLARVAAAMDPPLGVFASFSAVGAYGSRGDERLTEESSRGGGFLADVCAAWENSATPAAEAGIRVVHPRLGLVMMPRGGALSAMLPAFRAGLGARIGDGRQWWSWVAIDDVLAAVEWLLHDAALDGPVNVASPEPATNADVTKALAHVLHRPAALGVPEVLVRRVLGDMGREVLLASQFAVPGKLQKSGFAFAYPNLEAALGFLLGRR